MGSDIESLKAAFSGNTYWAECAAFAVFVGLIADIAVIIVFDLRDKEKSWWEITLAGIGALIIATGVWGEPHFGHRATDASSHIQAILGKEAADANERAANAQRKAVEDEIALAQLQENLRWRHIDADEKDVFGDSAGAALAGHTVIVSANPLDAEAKNFVEDIDACLKMAHAKVKRVFSLEISLEKGNLAPGLNCLATKGTASERDALVISHSLRVMAPPYPCAIVYRPPTDLGPVEINVGAKPEL